MSSPDKPDQPAGTDSFATKAVSRLADIFTRPLFTSPGRGAPKTANEVAERPGVRLMKALKRRLITYPLFIGAIASVGWVDNFVADQQPDWQYSQTALGQEMQEAQGILDDLPWHTHIAILDTEAIEAQFSNATTDELAAAIGSQMSARLPYRMHLMNTHMGGAYDKLADHLQSDSPVALNNHVPGLWWGSLPSTGRSDWSILGGITEKVAIVMVNPDVHKFAEEPLIFGNIFDRTVDLKGSTLNPTIMRQFILWHEIAHGLDQNQHFDKDRSAEMRSESFADAFGAIEMIARHGPQPEFFAKLAGLRTTGAYVLLSEDAEGGLGHYTTPVLEAAVAEATRLHESGALQRMDIRQKMDLSLRLTNQFAPSEADLERMSEIVNTLTERYGLQKAQGHWAAQSPLHAELARDIAASSDPRDTDAVKFFFQNNADFRADWLIRKGQQNNPAAPGRTGL
ncbi:MAG: hypothetical protein Alpg2KO_20850 [Alphaproteobacteria bacterium]